jgi:hypothetical protein
MFVVLAHAVLELPGQICAHLAASFLLAVLLGFFAFFVPDGLGVQEGALVVLLMPVVPSEVAAVLVVAGRIWQTAVLLICGAIGAVSLAGRRPRA